MPGLGAVRGMFGAVLLCSILALVFLIIGLVVPEWMTVRGNASTPVLDRVEKRGLFEFSSNGKCNTDECKKPWTDDLDKLNEPICKATMKLITTKQDHAECTYHGKGYCRCPYPEDNWTVEKSPVSVNPVTGKPVKGLCKSNQDWDDYSAEDMKEYNEDLSSAHSTTVIMLIIAIILVFLAIVLALVGAITAKWILGIVGAIFLCLALIFAIVGLIMGTNFTCGSLLSLHCGSQKSFDKAQELAGDKKLEYNTFATGPILVLVGIIFLFIACILDCMVSGLAKKIHKVADIDGDGRIG